MPADTGEALEEVTVADGPFASAFTAENAEDSAGVVREGLLPFDVVAARKGMAFAEMERWLSPNLGYEPT